MNQEIFVRLIVSAALGVLVGLERESAGKPAGIRTHALVSLGSCMFMLLAIEGPKVWGTTALVDPTRLAQGVVTGVGFLGAGAIIQSGTSVQGLTTAATIWLVCAVGATVGGGLWQIGGVGALVALILLRGLSFLERAATKVGRKGDSEENGG